MDRYNERLVYGKPEPKTKVKLGIAMFIIAASFAVMMAITMLAFIVFVIAVVFFMKTMDWMNLEYEYTLTNGDVDIAKILAKSRRKDIRSISADSITYVNYADSDRVKNDLDVKRGKAAIRDFSGKAGEDGKLVAIYSTQGDKESIDILNLNDKCILHLKEVLKTKCEIKDVRKEA